MIPGAILVCVGVSGALLAEWRGSDVLRRLAKPLASAGFLVAALGAPAWALPSGVAWLLFAGLLFSAVGDVLLLGRRSSAFVGGILAFSAAHIAYGAWFLGGRAPWWLLATTSLVFLGIGHLVWHWLDEHVSDRLRLPVRAYVALVSLMAATAVAYGAQALSTGSGARPMLLAPAVGGLLFYLSDLAVARHRFVTPAFANRAWGLPLYYLAQLLIAGAVS